ncbi:MAG TPA: hypothetical protein VHM93_10015 [Candidatus Acidoferrum sp.]|jgi:hypothetical protein|nr:hypothetical protein [Candidatus Acidoferrum sp.]
MTKTIKPFLMGSGLLTVLCAAGTTQEVATKQELKLPVVEILYLPGGSLLDRVCRDDFKVHIDNQIVQAAAQKRPEFQKQWDAEGPAYMNAALTEVGFDFPYHEMQATLTVCLPASTSIPLVVQVNKFLPTEKKPAPSWEFSEILFHELMHTYVTPVFAHSALMKKYQNEVPTTRYHLHVMAIEEMTLLRLNRRDDLKTIDHEYRNGPEPAYKRAWEIVNDIEGYEVFIKELKALKKPVL